MALMGGAGIPSSFIDNNQKTMKYKTVKCVDYIENTFYIYRVSYCSKPIPLVNEQYFYFQKLWRFMFLITCPEMLLLHKNSARVLLTTKASASSTGRIIIYLCVCEHDCGQTPFSAAFEFLIGISIVL